MVGLQEVELQEGQFIFGRKKAAEELSMTESKVYRLVKKLESMGNIILESNNKWTVVTIANWELYQGIEIENEQQMNNKRTTNEQQMNTNKNVKNVKNDKEDIYILTEDEKQFLDTLSKIENYPLDREKDLEMHKTLGERYPSLDLLEAIEQWRMYKLDKPLKAKSNPRSQINTAFKKYVEWGKCLKNGGGQSGPGRENSKQNDDQYAGIGFSYEDLQKL